MSLGRPLTRPPSVIQHLRQTRPGVWTYNARCYQWQRDDGQRAFFSAVTPTEEALYVGRVGEENVDSRYPRRKIA